jgi:hypothetical protein
MEKFAGGIKESAVKLVDLASSLTSLIGKISGILGWLDQNSSLGSDTVKGDAQRGMLGWGATGAFLGGMLAGPRGAAVGGALGAAAGGIAGVFTGQSRSKWTGPMPDSKAPPGQSFNPSSYPANGEIDPSILTGIQFFEERGLSREQAVGVVARLAYESGGGKTLNPNAFNPAGGGQGAYGIAQWRGSRQPAARAAGGDLTAQLWLVWNEMNAKYQEALRLIKNSDDPTDAARNMELYEGAGNPDFTERAARGAYNLYNRLPSSGPLTGASDPSLLDRAKKWLNSSANQSVSKSGRTSAQIKELLSRYSTAEMTIYRRRGSLDSDGVPVFPPGMPVNSLGKIYSPTFKSMSDAERNTEKLRSADWKAANERRDPSQLYTTGVDVTVRKPAGLRVTVEHETGASAPSAAAQVAR